MTKDNDSSGLYVLVDDVRDFYVDVVLRTADDARRFFANPQDVAHLYMDHDLGCVDRYGNDDSGYHVLTYILEKGHRPESVTLVTANPVGHERMAALLHEYGYAPCRKGSSTFERND